MRFLLLIVIVLSGNIVSAQVASGLVGYYSFDNHDVQDFTVNQNHGTITGDPSFECGVSGDALKLDGSDDYVNFLGNINTYFRSSSNFSINFYFRVTNHFGIHDILSKRQTCGPNNMLAIRFNPSSNQLLVDIAGNDDKIYTIRHRMKSFQCWHMVTLTKDRGSIKLYVDAEEIYSENFTGLLETDNFAALSIANSPCVGLTDRRFEGLIDELRIYNRAISFLDIRDLYLFPEQIIPVDTIVYKGYEFMPRTGKTCAEIVSWNPVMGVDEPDVLNTTLSPDDTTTYLITSIVDGCTTIDTFRVFVIDPDDLPCNDLPMATGFSPNGDGTNDTYGLSNPYTIDLLKSFQVYNRWGNLVFESTEATAQWDGTLNGKLLDPSSYIYKIVYICNDEEYTQNGEFLLFR